MGNEKKRGKEKGKNEQYYDTMIKIIKNRVERILYTPLSVGHLCTHELFKKFTFLTHRL
jgi:hypothetical protein